MLHSCVSHCKPCFLRNLGSRRWFSLWSHSSKFPRTEIRDLWGNRALGSLSLVSFAFCVLITYLLNNYCSLFFWTRWMPCGFVSSISSIMSHNQDAFVVSRGLGHFFHGSSSWSWTLLYLVKTQEFSLTSNAAWFNKILINWGQNISEINLCTCDFQDTIF